MDCRDVTEDAGAGGLLARLLSKALFCRRDRSGATALEFAMILPLLIVLIFGTIEVSMMYFTATTMEGEIQIAARQIRTGNIQHSDDPIEDFRELMCRSLENLTNCSKVFIDVQTFPDFGTFEPTPMEFDDEGNPEDETFDPGGAGDVVMVRIAYQYRILTPFLGDLVGATDGVSVLYAAAAFQNEPYDGPID